DDQGEQRPVPRPADPEVLGSIAARHSEIDVDLFENLRDPEPPPIAEGRRPHNPHYSVVEDVEAIVARTLDDMLAIFAKASLATVAPLAANDVAGLLPGTLAPALHTLETTVTKWYQAGRRLALRAWRAASTKLRSLIGSAIEKALAQLGARLIRNL